MCCSCPMSGAYFIGIWINYSEPVDEKMVTFWLTKAHTKIKFLVALGTMFGQRLISSLLFWIIWVQTFCCPWKQACQSWPLPLPILCPGTFIFVVFKKFRLPLADSEYEFPFSFIVAYSPHLWNYQHPSQEPHFPFPPAFPVSTAI